MADHEISIQRYSATGRLSMQIADDCPCLFPWVPSAQPLVASQPEALSQDLHLDFFKLTFTNLLQSPTNLIWHSPAAPIT